MGRRSGRQRWYRWTCPDCGQDWDVSHPAAVPPFTKGCGLCQGQARPGTVADGQENTPSEVLAGPTRTPAQ